MIGEEDESGETADAGEAPQGVNLSDPKQVKARNKKANAREELRKRFIARLLSDRDGREWMWELLAFCKVFSSTYVAGDPYAMHLLEGQRNVGLKLVHEIPPASMKLMMDEGPSYDG